MCILPWLIPITWDDVFHVVHDETGLRVHEDDLDETMDKMVRVMTKSRLSWLNIPIAVEVKSVMTGSIWKMLKRWTH